MTQMTLMLTKALEQHSKRSLSTYQKANIQSQPKGKKYLSMIKPALVVATAGRYSEEQETD